MSKPTPEEQDLAEVVECWKGTELYRRELAYSALRNELATCSKYVEWAVSQDYPGLKERYEQQGGTVYMALTLLCRAAGDPVPGLVKTEKGPDDGPCPDESEGPCGEGCRLYAECPMSETDDE